MRISELLDLFMDPEWQKIEVYDTNTEKTLFCGLYAEYLEKDMEDFEIQSIDNLYEETYILTINVDAGDGD